MKWLCKYEKKVSETSNRSHHLLFLSIASLTFFIDCITYFFYQLHHLLFLSIASLTFFIDCITYFFYRSHHLLFLSIASLTFLSIASLTFFINCITYFFLSIASLTFFYRLRNINTKHFTDLVSYKHHSNIQI